MTIHQEYADLTGALDTVQVNWSGLIKSTFDKVAIILLKDMIKKQIKDLYTITVIGHITYCSKRKGFSRR